MIGKKFEKHFDAKAFEMAEAGAFMFSKTDPIECN
jgi:hypothetical protein